MSVEHVEQEPPFRSMVRASGLGEVWTHVTDGMKFNQFGWRCTTKENSYGNDTLIGNWDEKRYDVGLQKEAKRLPSQYEHYFETTNGVCYNTKPPYSVPDSLKHLKARHPHAHPGHQPELDLPKIQDVYNSWETTMRAAYVNPQVRKTPLVQKDSACASGSNMDA